MKIPSEEFMKKDITTTDDIKMLLDSFYAKVLKDDLIAYFFHDVARINLEAHMPHLYAFWNSVLFGTAGYSGNPMLKHIELDKKEPLKDIHFARWQKLFFETIDELFEGKTAALAKEKAKAMDFLMKMKIADSHKSGFIQ